MGSKNTVFTNMSFYPCSKGSFHGQILKSLSVSSHERQAAYLGYTKAVCWDQIYNLILFTSLFH